MAVSSEFKEDFVNTLRRSELSEKELVQREIIIELVKENEELKAKIKGFENGEVAWQGDMDMTIKQNIETIKFQEIESELRGKTLECIYLKEENEKLKQELRDLRRAFECTI